MLWLRYVSTWIVQLMGRKFFDQSKIFKDALARTIGFRSDACGTLSDIALAHALVNEACFVICPCCYRSNPYLQIPVTWVERDKQPQAHLKVEDWLRVDKTSLDALKHVAETQGNIPLANVAIHSICSLRVESFLSRSRRPYKVTIKTFPIAFSTRNFCLVGVHT
jgi:hypothetical protein